MIFLVRHAHAGDKSAWRAADELRPLSPRGWQESAGIVRRLGGFDLTAALASPALRCVQTVEELADERGLPLEIDDRLRRDADPAEILELAADEAYDRAVLCTHGELIGAVLALLRARGVALPADAEWPKGSTWLLDLDDRDAAEVVFLPALRAPVRVLR